MDANSTEDTVTLSMVKNSAYHTRNGNPSPFGVTAVTINVIFFILIVGENALVLYAIKKYKNLQTVTNVYLANLAVADLMFGMINLPIMTYNIILFIISDPFSYKPNKYECLTYASLWHLFFMVTVLSLFGVSCERYIAVLRPLYHATSVTMRRVVISVLIIWITSIFVAFLLMIDIFNLADELENCTLIMSKLYPLIIVMLVNVVVLVTIGIYIHIGLITWRHKKAISAQHGPNSGNAGKNSKLSKMLAIILGCYLVCLIPYQSINVYLLVLRTTHPSPQSTVNVINIDTAFLTVNAIATYLLSSNSWINPLIYAGLNQNFREAFKKILGCG